MGQGHGAGTQSGGGWGLMWAGIQGGDVGDSNTAGTTWGVQTRGVWDTGFDKNCHTRTGGGPVPACGVTSRMWSWHVSCALWRVLRPFLQGADPAGGGLPAEPEAEGGLRGTGGAAEPKPGCAENIPGKWGLGRSWELDRERVPGGPLLPTGVHEVWVDVPNSPRAPQTLSLQRQMMENLVIAKAREETLQRKMEERRLRLQEAANRRFSSSVALTPEEQEQRALYAAILEYEQDHDWPRQWKVQLKRSPADLSVVSGLFSCLLSCPEHPISQLLRRLQCAVYARLYPAVSRGPADASPGSPSALSFLSLDAGGSSLPAEPGGRRLRASRSLHCMFSVPEHGPAALRHSHSSTPLADSGAAGPAEPPEPPRESSFEDLERFLASPEGWAPAEPPASSGQDAALPELLKGVVRDIHNAIDRLLALTLLAFEGLGTAAGKDQCLACLEEAFFPPLWAPLLALYRTVQQPREAALARSMERHRHAGPADMGLASRLFPPGPGRPAYASAVQDLRLMALESCPRRKLECIVRALRGICECAEEYCGSRDGRSLATAAIGADDLLPILSYVVLQTGLPQLLSECAALEEFIHEGYLIGEEGYCLTSLQSALSYVESLQ
uniref:VPS9 domain containing 1 n=1 Tax=Junco hyemalis TaxID=40217 RepID=A0A8C5IUI8_JUNHY